MRIAFYAPMKAPDDPRPSGDRTVARGLIAALRLAGHEVAVVSRLRSWDAGDPERQARLRRLGERLADRMERRSGGRPPYDLWLTYHFYHKAPDWLGPRLSEAWGIPYVVAEASLAGKQRGGPWDRGYHASLDALSRADLVLGLNPADRPCVLPALRPGTPYLDLPPFLDARPFVAAAGERENARARLLSRLGIADDGTPLLLAVGMMRADQKLKSYRILAAALKRVESPFRLVVAGAGPAEAEVRAAFGQENPHVHYLGAVPETDLPELCAAVDLYVWPAVKEAFGMAFLEAQAAGLPVVAGLSGGVANVVSGGVTGLLAPEGDAVAFAEMISRLIDDAPLRWTMGAAAQLHVRERHDLPVAAAALDRALTAAVEGQREAKFRKAV
ncbi:glycosyltransferase family 4 protein [Aurantimonas sp. VKM B-3413]|uniref:glycosyltransferase family 4 protein n=1 Tax=Aurantimonas sp. VKM B-3413 TaxID=2779401 RepID=UPI001E642842|nr:glycosyltransferase family 4 protein [Aurantimonas sp. VKM B-3413]MCB8836731.1 glycosyltransferase family 4 protein [Aurantimonas sp. VKM B-3413]